jgi:uncharacterized protein
MPARFHVLAKPVSAACNLACRYCYYLHRAGRPASRRMSRDVLEAYVRDTFAGQPDAEEVYFSWQGGEPTLAGLAFFREAVALQARYARPGQQVRNALQTNATLVDASWAAFFAEHGFLVGVSLDGPAHLHDPLRRSDDGRATHAATLRGLERLQRAGVECNALSVVHRLNYRRGREVYRYLRRLGLRHMQFIPLVERLGPGEALAAPPPADPQAALAPWVAPEDGFGRFLCDVYDDWLARDLGVVFVQQIEEFALALAGEPARLCVSGHDCSGTPLLEASGDLYSCDHYAYPDYRLGNILRQPIGALLGLPAQAAFGAAKREPLPRPCEACRYREACMGGCPKHRFVPDPGGGPAGNYLCASYRRFFAHAERSLARVVAGILAER